MLNAEEEWSFDVVAVHGSSLDALPVLSIIRLRLPGITFPYGRNITLTHFLFYSSLRLFSTHSALFGLVSRVFRIYITKFSPLFTEKKV